MAAGADLPLAVPTGAAPEAAPAVPDAGPARADTLLPLPADFQRSWSGTLPDAPCTGPFCEIGTVDILMAVPIGLLLVFVLISGTVQLVRLLWTVASRGIDLLGHALDAGLELVERPLWRARSAAVRRRQEAGRI